MNRVFYNTPEEIARIALDLEKCSPESLTPDTIEIYAHGLISRGFSRQDLDTFWRSMNFYYESRGYGELTPNDVGRIGYLQGVLSRLLE